MLYHDGDLRRIYEVPVDSTFTVDQQGYRRYVPNDPLSAQQQVRIPVVELWSRFVDYRQQEEWSTLAYDKEGGGFRFQDPATGDDVFATYDLRLINGWQIVPADYPHSLSIVGNLFPNIDTGLDFDYSRLTSQGVSPRILFADSLQTISSSEVTTGTSGNGQDWLTINATYQKSNNQTVVNTLARKSSITSSSFNAVRQKTNRAIISSDNYTSKVC